MTTITRAIVDVNIHTAAGIEVRHTLFPSGATPVYGTLSLGSTARLFFEDLETIDAALLHLTKLRQELADAQAE